MSKIPIAMKLKPRAIKMSPVVLKNFWSAFYASKLSGNSSHVPVITNLSMSPND